MDRSSLTRGTRWCQNYSPSFSSLEVIHEKNHFQKTYFLPLVTSHTYSITLTANPRAHIDSGDPGLSFGYLTIPLASTVIEIIAIICENSPILIKFEKKSGAVIRPPPPTSPLHIAGRWYIYHGNINGKRTHFKSNPAPQETVIITNYVIWGKCEVIRGHWPQVTSWNWLTVWKLNSSNVLT